MVDFGMILAARENIASYVKRTPLIRAERLERLFGGAEIYLKLENLQHTGSFKARGAANKMTSLSERDLSRGVTAASSGNHAQAVAYMAAKMGVKAVIVMPENAPAQKIAGTKYYGAETILFGLTVGERESKCNELIDKYGYSLVHSFEDAALIAGHGTMAIEAAEQIAMVDDGGFDEIVIPCGAGAIVSGVAVAAKSCMKEAAITAVEPAAVPLLSVSLREGGPSAVEMGATIADGLRVNRTDPINFALIRDYAVRVVTVGEDSIGRAVYEALDGAKILGEPSACVGIAAALEKKVETRAGRRICFIISGGNTDARALSDILTKYSA
jgi:threonine dehydratase